MEFEVLLYMACCCHCELYRYSFLLLLLGSRCFFRSLLLLLRPTAAPDEHYKLLLQCAAAV